MGKGLFWIFSCHFSSWKLCFLPGRRVLTTCVWWCCDTFTDGRRICLISSWLFFGYKVLDFFLGGGYLLLVFDDAATLSLMGEVLPFELSRGRSTQTCWCLHSLVSPNYQAWSSLRPTSSPSLSSSLSSSLSIELSLVCVVGALISFDFLLWQPLPYIL